MSAGTSISLTTKEKLRYAVQDANNKSDILEPILYYILDAFSLVKYWSDVNNESSAAAFSKLVSGIVFALLTAYKNKR